MTYVNVYDIFYESISILYSIICRVNALVADPLGPTVDHIR